MTRHIILDSTALAIISHPAQSAPVISITQWAADCLLAGHKIYVPEVIDYAIRREFYNTELVLRGASDSLRQKFSDLGFRL